MKKFIIAVFVVFSTIGLRAQHHEIGPFVGITYYMGDLVESRIFSTPSYAFGLNYRYNINNRFAVKIAGHYGKVIGDSKYNKENLQYKNLDFYSQILDIEAGFEINFLEYEPGSKNHRFTPYIFGGVGIFSFNPKTTYMGVEYELQPLGTEGQGLTYYPDKKYYKLSSFSIPFGGGIKWSLTSKLSIGLEWGMRKTFTDYIDDVSTEYADVSILKAEKGAVASALSNRVFEDEVIAAGWDISIGPNGQPVNNADFQAYMDMQKSNYPSGSQRGGKDENDWYSIAGLTVMFKIVGPRKGNCPAYRNKSYYHEYEH